jgi:hypothetical protein
MFLVKWRNFVCLPMIVILPVSLLTQDTAAAMLRSNGIGVQVNRYPAPASTALFSGDYIETLEHGSLSVNTSRGMQVKVGCLTVTPVNNTDWTHYDVVDLDGKVTVSALKSDVYIDARSKNPKDAKQSGHSDRIIVREGEQKSREEKCGAAYLKTPGAIAGKGAIMNSPWAIGAGVAGVGAALCFGLFCQNDDPASPTKP